jgi:hypothetical protein
MLILVVATRSMAIGQIRSINNVRPDKVIR